MANDGLPPEPAAPLEVASKGDVASGSSTLSRVHGKTHFVSVEPIDEVVLYLQVLKGHQTQSNSSHSFALNANATGREI